MKKIISLLLSFGVFVSINSCKKLNDAPTPVDEMVLLMKNWVMTAGKVDPPVLGMTDFFANWGACERDDIYKFSSNNVFIRDEGPSKCNSSNPQTKTGTWTYNTATKKLWFKAVDAYNMTVIELNETTLKATTKDTISGIIYTGTFTFKAQ